MPGHPPERFLSALSSNRGDHSDRHPSEPSIMIRAARPQDLTALTNMLASSFHSQEGVMGLVYPLLRMGIQEDLRQRLRNRSPHYACLVAVGRSLPVTPPTPEVLNPVGGSETLAGTAEIALRQYSFWQFRTAPYLYISNLATERQYRRRGVAMQLLHACDQLALQWGFQDIYLHVLEDNYAARRLYLKAGYRLEHAETSVGSMLLGHPRQLFLRKQLTRS